MQPTQRTYTNVETKYKCRIYTSLDGSKFHLIYEDNDSNAPSKGSEVNGYYIAPHTGATIKLNTGKQIFVNSGEFYNYKEGENATHRKFIGFTKFTKL
jgi:hypothetical protein